MLIGMGGGAASSMGAGANVEDLDFDSVQRGNAEIERRAQEVIDRCWQLGEANPILSIHDVGAGGLSNALPELVHGGGRGARFELRAIPTEDSGMSPREIWCNEAQERYVLAIAPREPASAFDAICERERCPFAVRRHARPPTAGWSSTTRSFGNSPVDMPLEVLLGKPPKMLRDVTRVARAAAAACRSTSIDARRRGVPRAAPPGGGRQDLPRHDRRSHRRRAVLARPDGRARGRCRSPTARSRCSDYEGYAGEAMAIGERTPLALIDAPASGRMAVGEAITNLAAAPIATLSRVKLSANWMAAAGHPGEDAALFDTVRAVALELCPALGVSIPVGKDSLSMRTAWDGKEVGARRCR